MEETKEETESQFKVPLIISKVNDNVSKPISKPEKPLKIIGDTKNVHQNQNVPLPYEEPSWSGIPPDGYNFEVIKSGVIVTTIQIQKSFLTVGRLTTCDITLEHPSVSRYHSIIQYCNGNDKYPKGFYVYDLTSTHGTFLNKNKISPKTYYNFKLGHVLKFGGSTRLFILGGPEEEDEEEEIKTESSKSSESSKPGTNLTSEEACSWGIADDAEEEDDLSVNPFALSTENEDMYIEDPKKTLRGWFEREGYELDYIVEEKGFKTFSCRVKLPIDTPTGDYLTVEASVSGKKKEAVIACALEACRTLDRHALLRQSHHSSREKKKKNWEQEDFYDSDEDIYLDRTGTIEKKRQNRMSQVKKATPETFSSLEKKLQDINEKINSIESKINSNIPSNSSGMDSVDEDPLDSYMCEIQCESVDKVTKSRLKLELIDLMKEKSELEKLLNIVKPAALPPRRFPNMIGKRIKSKLKLPPSDLEINKPSENNSSDVEKDEEEIKEMPAKKGKIYLGKKVDTIPEEKKEIENIEKEEVKTSLSKAESKSDVIKETTDKTFVIPKSISLGKEPKKHKLSSDTSENTSKRTHSSKKEKKDVYKATDDKYSMWMPPTNQSGDGSTHLNLKYGY